MFPPPRPAFCWLANRNSSYYCSDRYNFHFTHYISPRLSHRSFFPPRFSSPSFSPLPLSSLSPLLLSQSTGQPSNDAVRAGLRNRAAATKASSTVTKNNGRGAGGSSAGILRFYTDDSPGIKIGPNTVLIGSLSFIGLVVMLHIWGKLRS